MDEDTKTVYEEAIRRARKAHAELYPVMQGYQVAPGGTRWFTDLDPETHTLFREARDKVKRAIDRIDQMLKEDQ